MNPKHTLYGELARIGKALSHPVRIQIVDLLSQSERTVESIAAETGLSMTSASQQLRVLREARLVETRKEGLHVHYRLADEAVGAALHFLRRAGERRLAEIPRALASMRAGVEAISREELLGVLSTGSAVLVDVRPREEFAAGHIPGAYSIPLDELELRLSELPRDREVIACCRGPWCAWASTAVRQLRAHGFRARAHEEGPVEWRLAGLRVVPA